MENDQIVSRMNTYLHTSAKFLEEWLGKLLPITSDEWWEECVMEKLSYNQRETAMGKGFTRLGDFDLAALLRIADKSCLENASLKWFMDAEAITQEDYDIYQNIRKRRNDIIHELLKILNVGFGEEDAQLFADMLRIYNKLDKWWINEIEIPTSADDIPKDYDRDGVCGGQALMLLIINEIVFGNERDKYKELLNILMKSDMSDFV